MGVALTLSLINRAYERGRIDDMVLAAVWVAMLVGVLGLGSAQYTDKSSQLQFLIRFVPEVRGFPGAERGFNVNEIGGAMAYFAPFTAGVAIHDWRTRKARFRQAAATVAFILLALGLFLGQSRLAIVGVVGALGLLTFLLIPVGRWRYIALAGLVAFSVIEVLIIANIFEPPAAAVEMNERDEDSFNIRLEIWTAGLNIVRDFPLTGVGQNMYRAAQVRDVYPVPGYGDRVVPHAHNELLQVGTDLGIPGMILFVAWNGMLGVMIWRTWRKGSLFLKAVAVSAGAGLLTHVVFGAADAITLYDRFTFAYWLLVGLAGGAYILALREQESAPQGVEVAAPELTLQPE
jgi:O-antigen ligase